MWSLDHSLGLETASRLESLGLSLGTPGLGLDLEKLVSATSLLTLSAYLAVYHFEKADIVIFPN